MRDVLRFGCFSLLLFGAACGDDTAETGNGGGGASSSSSSSSSSAGPAGSTSSGGATSSASQSATSTASASSGSGDGGGGSSGDGGAGGSGDGGAGTGGTGGSGGAGEGGGLPLCVVDPTTTVAVPGFQIETLAEGDPLVDPVGLMFGLDGELYVGNSHSWLTVASTEPAEIFRVDDDGDLTLLVTDDRMRGTAWAAFAPGGAPGGPGIAYMGTEDVKEGFARFADWLAVYDGETFTLGPDSYENGKLDFGPGGDWGTDLYIIGRELPGKAALGPSSLLTWDLDATPVPVEIVDEDTDLRLAIESFTFGRGGDLGTDMYVATFDDGELTPSQEVGIWRVDATLEATRLTEDLPVLDLTASPDASGPWGDFLYAGDFEDGLHRIGADGEVTDFVTGLGAPGGLVFGPDGALYVTEIAGKRIRKITPCAPPGE